MKKIKIYSKPTFFIGMVTVVCSIIAFVLDISGIIDFSDILIDALLLTAGMGSVQQSVNERYSKKSKFEETDERNEFLDTKSRSLAFMILKDIVLTSIICFLVASFFNKNERMLAVFAAVCVVYLLMSAVEALTYRYFENNY